MAFLDSQDLLARCKRLANRPATDDLVADADWYAWLTEGQQVLVAKLATVAPHAMLTVPTLITSSDGGYTYTFASSQYPLAVTLYETEADIPSFPLVPGVDYTWEGDVVRMPDDSPRTFPDGGLWAQYVPQVAASATLDGSNAPIVFPVEARLWLIPYAMEQYAVRVNQDPTYWLTKQALTWMGNPADPSDVGILGRLRLSTVVR